MERFKTWARASLSPSVRGLVLPILAEQGFTMLLGTVNAVMASHIGTEAVSAIGMVDTLNMMMFAFFSAIAVGATIVVSYYLAREDGVNASETVKQALYASGAIGLLITVLLVIFHAQLLGALYGAAEQAVLDNARAYLYWSALSYPMIALTSVSAGVLRGAGDSRTPMFITLAMNVANVLLGALFIYGVNIGGVHIGGWGITGAALAILGARAVGAVLSLLALGKSTTALTLIKPLRYRPNLPILKSILNIGIPTGMDNLLFNFGKIIVQVFVVACGTSAIAANYYTGPIANLINLPGLAVSTATSILVGRCMGSGDTDGARRMMFGLTTMTMAVMGALCVIVMPLSPLLLRIFSPPEDVFGLTLTYMYLTCVATPLFWPAAFLLPNGLRAAGDARFCMVVSVASMWIVRIGAGYVLSALTPLGVIGVWLAMFLDWVARGALFAYRHRSGKWLGRKVLYEAEG